MRNGDRLQSLTDSFQQAAIDGSGWHSALQSLADATGSRCGQLMGKGAIGSNSFDRENFNIVTNFDPADLEQFGSVGGFDPAINPRVGVAMTAPILQVLAETDFLTEDQHRRHPHYREYAQPYDIPFICMTPLERQGEMMIGLAVLRSEREGHISGHQRAVFAAAAPFVRAAVHTQIALEGQGSALLSGLLDALSIPAFLCDGRGAVKAVSVAAERLIDGAGSLQLKYGRLLLPRPEDTRKLEKAIRAATDASGSSSRRMFQTIVVHRVGGALPLVLDVIALPARDYEFSFTPRVLITAGGPEKAERQKVAILSAAYSLTAAETDIAVRLSSGESAETIAAQRSVAVGTVRAQIKTLLAKFGARRQAELVARLGQLWS